MSARDDVEKQPDIDWSAFRYVAGEMSRDELLAFEERLQSDLALCEAVADAVELSAAIAQASVNAERLSSVPPQRHSGALSPLIAGALAFALSVVAAAVVVFPQPRRSQIETALQQPEPSVAALAESWSALRDAEPLACPPFNESWLEFESEHAAADDFDSLFDDDDADAEPELPAWLLSAVALDRFDADEEIQN